MYEIISCNYEWQVGVVVMMSACHAEDPSSIPTRAMIFFYGICMFIVHQSSDFMYQFINMHLHLQQSTIGVVVLTPASHLGEWGSNPIRALLL